MPTRGLKGMKSTEGRKGTRVHPGANSLASAHDGGAGSRNAPKGLGSRKSSLQALRKTGGPGKRLI